MPKNSTHCKPARFRVEWLLIWKSKLIIVSPASYSLEHNVFSWEAPTRSILSNCLTTSGMASSQSMFVRGSVRVHLGHWQTWAIDHLSRKPVLLFHCPSHTEMLPDVHSKPPWCCKFELFPHVPSLDPGRREQHLPARSPPQEAADHGKVTPSLLFSKPGSPKVPNCSFS